MNFLMLRFVADAKCCVFIVVVVCVCVVVFVLYDLPRKSEENVTIPDFTLRVYVKD